MQKGIYFVRELDDNTEYYHDTWINYVTKYKLEWNNRIKSAFSIINHLDL